MKQNNIIGIIGGMGPQASCELHRLMIDYAHHQFGVKNNDEYPEILIDSVPVPDFLSDTKEMEKAALMLEDRVVRLTHFGVTVITMACNTACILCHRLKEKTSVPFISIIEEVVQKVIHEERKKVLLLASPTSLRLGLYQLELAHYGVGCVIPQKNYYQELEYIIRSVIEGNDKTCLMKKLVKIVHRHIDYSIDGIVLGCTELPLVFPKQFQIPVYSSLSILSETLVKTYYRKEHI